jgi:hypothetical protein
MMYLNVLCYYHWWGMQDESLKDMSQWTVTFMWLYFGLGLAVVAVSMACGE